MAVTPPMNLPLESAPWGRDKDLRIESLEREMARRASGEENSNKTQNATLQSLAAQIIALPVPAGYAAKRTGFSLAAAVYVDQVIPIPANKTRVVLTAIGNAQALDMTSGGAAVAYASIDVVGSGFVWSTPVISASKDAGASVVNNILTPALGFEQGGLVPGQTFTVTLSLSASNPAAYTAQAQNFGTLTIAAIFYN
jgi:hypothetical protein